MEVAGVGRRVVDLGLKDAIAVVLGGGRGMGLAAARCLADDGARVALVGRTRAVLDSATADLSQRGSPDAVAFVADAEDEHQVQQVFDEISVRWGGGLNILINTVGPGVQGSFEQLGDDQWRTAVDGGVMGMVHCVRSALPLLRKAQWARIVNFSAQSTQRQSPNLVAYTAAKAMVTSISKNLSQLSRPTRSWSTWSPRQHRLRGARRRQRLHLSPRRTDGHRPRQDMIAEGYTDRCTVCIYPTAVGWCGRCAQPDGRPY